MLHLSQGLMCSPQLRPGTRFLATRSSRPACLIVHAAKGFGKTKRSNKEDVNTSGKKPKRVNVRPQTPVMPAGMDVAVQRYEELEAAKKAAEEEAEFAARLELIKAEAAQKKAAGLVPAAAASAAAASTQPRAVFDAPAQPEDIYANPPSILSTLQEQLQSDINDPALRQAKIGPGQLGLAGGALMFGLIFVLVSGGDFATTNRYKGVRPARPPPDPIEMSRLARQAEGFEAKLQANPDDLEALEAAAVTYARMQDFEKAATLLDDLTAAHPDDVEAWRLLGESRLLSADSAKAVAAYEKAVTLDPNDQQILTGLVDAYVADSKQAKAVGYLTDLRTKILAQADTAAAAAAASSSSSGDAAAVFDSSSSGSSSSAAAEASTSDRITVDPIGVQLLLGKSYAAWRGHDQDALAAYDTLIGAFPTDFRGYLAKGMFLKERGRQGDAERMFLQAKFYAPENLQEFVAARSGEQAVIEPLPDNGME